jgi:hypothetical protein
MMSQAGPLTRHDRRRLRAARPRCDGIGASLTTLHGKLQTECGHGTDMLPYDAPIQEAKHLPESTDSHH